MTRKRAILFGSAFFGMSLFFGRLYATGCFEGDVWKREQPLSNPIVVTAVQDGSLTLADGRIVRVAGVVRRDDVLPTAYDEALRVVAAQGVEVVRDLGDGRVFLLAEPKFYNWCGTCGMQRYKGKSLWGRWAGSYLRCPVSELLIQSAYARPNLEEPGLDARDRWRLEGAEHTGYVEPEPRRISKGSMAFRYDGSECVFDDYDQMVELMWQPPPR